MGGIPEPEALAVPIIPEGPSEPEPSSRLAEGILALGVAALITVLGFPLGWIWSALAPWVPAQKVPGGAVLAQPEQEQMIADEGWYLLIMVLAGLILAVLAWVLLRRYRGGLMLLGLAVGGVLGGVLTLHFGHHIGYAHFLHLARSAPDGTQFLAPVNLRVEQNGLWHHWLPYARGDVLALAIAATALYLLLAGFSAHPSLRTPDRDQTGTPPYHLAVGGYPGVEPPQHPGTGPASLEFRAEPASMEFRAEPPIGGGAGPGGAGPGGMPLSSDS